MRQPRIFHLVQKAHSALFRASDHALKEGYGLTASQQAILFVLMKKDGSPISEIADELRMGKSSLTGLVDRMTFKGLVSRRKNADDGRSFEIWIEESGRKLVEATVGDTKRINSKLLEPFSTEERKVVERFLQHVSENAEAIVNRQTEHNFERRKTS